MLDGFTARCVSLRMLIQEAYGIYDNDRMSGEREWVDSRKFDVEAKFDATAAPNYKDLSRDQRRLMLRALLADRFKLMLHLKTSERDVYALIVSKDGPRLNQTPPEKRYNDTIYKGSGLVLESVPGHLKAQDMSMPKIADLLHYSAGRLVIDKTKLTGHYDISLNWTPDNLPVTPSNSAWPSLFTAIQEQLGLKLQPMKLPVDTLVIDHAEIPSAN